MSEAIADEGIVPEWTAGDRLRKARELTGLSMSEFARALGVSRNTIMNYEHCLVEPRVVMLRAWAAFTGVSLDWLAGFPVGPARLELATNGLVVPNLVHAA